MRAPRAVLAFAAVSVLGLGVVGLYARRHGWLHRSHDAPQGPAQATRAETPIEVAQWVYDGGLKNGWEDNGWTGRDVKGPGPAKLEFTNWGGWIIGKDKNHERFSALVFRYKPPPGQPEFLEVRVESSSNTVFPRIALRSEDRRDVGDGWIEVLLSMKELDPSNLPFDKIVFRPFRQLQASEPILMDKIGLVAIDHAKELAATAKLLTDAKPARLRIDCREAGKPVHPGIYGVAFNGVREAEESWWKMGATGRRWGGNTTTRYNWELGDAWNTGLDWFWENVSGQSYTVFLDDDAAHGMKSALTVPTLGWVAKDTKSSSFTSDRYPDQQAFDDFRKTAGNGKSKDGKELKPPDPTTTSIAITPDFVKRWVEKIRARDAEAGTRSVDIYMLDNEPGLWDSTHRDVHPEPMTYDELLDKTLRYGAAVRAADKDAVISGPASWGWPEYFFSAKDARAGFFFKPDRRAHNDVPLIAWYLRRLKEEEAKTGVHILDLLDVHFYPQAEGMSIQNSALDPASNALRIRQTRGLWDPSYVDESYIKEPVRLLPRMHEWINQEYPGRGVVIGEWSFGAEGHMSGGLASAEALGRFVQNDVTAAYYWQFPAINTPVYYAFRAYRDFDGKGGRFQDWWIPTFAPDRTSLFASRDREGKHVVAVMLNFAPDAAFNADIDVTSCGRVASRTTHVYTGTDDAGFTAKPAVSGEEGHMRETILPYSITVFDMQLAEPLPSGVKP